MTEQVQYLVQSADGATYGPVPLAVVRQWVIQGRVAETTEIAPAGTANFRPARDYPELAEAFILPLAPNTPNANIEHVQVRRVAASPDSLPASTTTPPKRRNTCGVASLIAGIVAACMALPGSCSLFCCLGWPAAVGAIIASIVGLVIGVVGLVQVWRNPERYRGKGPALAGLVVSAAVLGLLAAAGIIAGLAARWHT